MTFSSDEDCKDTHPDPTYCEHVVQPKPPLCEVDPMMRNECKMTCGLCDVEPSMYYAI